MRKIKSKTIHEEVTTQLREMIRDGLLVKGQKVDEKFLSETMGVSRTPIRESLRVLCAEGLIELVPNRGAYVTDPPIEFIQDLFEVMSVLEGTAARLAVEKMTDKDLQKIESLQQDLEHYYHKRDHKTYLQRNNVLHVFIQDLTGNKVLRQVTESLRQKILMYRHRQLYEDDRFNKSVEEHRAILEAFRKKDPGLAEAAMKEHLMNQCKVLASGSTSKGSDREGKGATG